MIQQTLGKAILALCTAAVGAFTQVAVAIADVCQSNGVIHVVDKVLLPKQAACQHRAGLSFGFSGVVARRFLAWPQPWAIGFS